MILKARLALFSATLFVALAGCGGTGIDEALIDPNGAFTISLVPTTDGSFVSRQFAVEMEASGGTITSGFARYVQASSLASETTTNVSGDAHSGFIDLTAQFKTFRFEVETEHNGLSWHGHYKVFEGDKVVDEGAIQVSRSNSTASIEDRWFGTIRLNGKDEDADIEFVQKGNLIAFEGTVGGLASIGTGSIIGRSVHFELQSAPEAGWPQYLGTVTTDGSQMIGVGEESTYSLQRGDPPK